MRQPAAAQRCLALALMAALAACARAAFEPLAHPGGPPILEGLCDVSQMDPETQFPTVLAVGWTVGDKYSYTFYTGGEVLEQTGKYLSWQCGELPGTFTAIIEQTTKYPNGTRVEKTVCQYSEVYLEQEQMSWTQSEDGCPKSLPPEGGELINTLYSLPRPATFACGNAAQNEIEEWERLAEEF